MKPLKVRTYYGNLSEHALVTQAGKALQFMTENLNFPTPDPDLEAFETVYLDYKTKLEKANNGGSRLDFRRKKEARLVLLDRMRELATHVNLITAPTLPPEQGTALQTHEIFSRPVPKLNVREPLTSTPVNNTVIFL